MALVCFIRGHSTDIPLTCVKAPQSALQDVIRCGQPRGSKPMRNRRHYAFRSGQEGHILPCRDQNDRHVDVQHSIAPLSLLNAIQRLPGRGWHRNAIN